MKNYEEMAKYVLEVRDEYVRKKKRRQAVIKKYAPVVSGFCFALVVGFGAWQYMSEFPDIPTKSYNTEIITDITETTSSTDTTHKHATVKTTVHHTTATVITQAVTTEEIIITDTPVYTTTTKPAPETSFELPETEELPVITKPVITDYIITDTVIATEPVTEEVVTETVVTETFITESMTTTDITYTSVPDEVSEVPTTASGTLQWEDMPINQQYNMAEFGTPSVFYMTADKEVSADETGDFISQAYMSGYDYYTDTYYHCYTNAFRITDSNDIAIRFQDDDRYYLYTMANGGNEYE